MAAPLFIIPAVREQAKAVADYARANKVGIHAMMRSVKAAADGKLVPLGHDDNRVLRIPVGFYAVYSIEQHPSGWYHHFSMSSPNPGRLPVPEGVDMVLEAMDIPFKHDDACKAWIEEISEGRSAINLMFPFNE